MTGDDHADDADDGPSPPVPADPDDSTGADGADPDDSTGTDDGGDSGELGIAALGGYAPRGRLATDAIEEAWGTLEASGIESVAVPAADEDPVTMAHEAARRALSAADCPGLELEYLAFASTTPPLDEEELVVRLGAALNLSADATLQTAGASTRAGTRALWAALDADRAPALVVAADAPRGDPADRFGQGAGAGAAAVLLDRDAPGRVVDRAEYGAAFPGTRFRTAGDDRTRGLGITGYDRRAFRETVAGAVDGLEEAPDPEAAAIQSPDGALPYRVADAVGASTDEVRRGTVVHELGDAGAASALLGLTTAVASGHGRVLAVGYGSGGGADALVVDLDDAVPVKLAPGLADGTELRYAEALRRRGEITPAPPEGGGAYVSVPSWRRSLPQRYRLEAGQCPDCRTLAFPPEGACPGCGSLVEFSPVELLGRGTVEAVTTIGQGGAPPEFAPQQARGGPFGVAVVAFDGPGDDRGTRGGRPGPGDVRTVSAPVQVAGDHPVPEVGDRVEAVLRRVYTQEGVTRYGTKVRPV